MPPDDDSIAAVQKVLGEPVFAEFDPKAQRIRTTLFIVSVIGIAYVIGGLSIQEGSTFLGLRFRGLDDSLFLYFIFGTTLYMGIHFLWSSIDSLLEWRIRVTGTRVTFLTAAKFVSEHSDNPTDPRQSSLSNWWQGQARLIGDIGGKIDNVITHVDKTNELIEALPDDHNMHVIEQMVQHVRKETSEAKVNIGVIRKIIAADRIPVSLDRYDKWFSLFLRSQNLRWLLIEFLLPLLLAGVALLLLGSKLFS